MRCAREGAEISNVFKCPGFELGNLVVDSMHTADLGCFCDALGSLFWLEIANKDWYRNQEEGIAALNRQLDANYRENKVKGLSKVTPLVLSQIVARKPGYPWLKAKAASVRHLAEFGTQLANNHMHGRDGLTLFAFPARHRLAPHKREHLDLLLDMFRGMSGYTRSMERCPFEAEECRTSMLLFLRSLSALHHLWRAGVEEIRINRQPFALRPKAHMLQHLVQDHISVFGNPAQYWCYRDEDFCGSVKCICARTKYPSTLETRVMQKIRLLAGLGCRV